MSRFGPEQFATARDFAEVNDAFNAVAAERNLLLVVLEAAHELLDAEMDADSWTDYHTALQAAVDVHEETVSG